MSKRLTLMEISLFTLPLFFLDYPSEKYSNPVSMAYTEICCPCTPAKSTTKLECEGSLNLSSPEY